VFNLFTQTKDKETPPVIPYWAFGHWVWEDERNTRDAAVQLLNGYKKHNIPVGALLIDSPWMNSYNDFDWDTDRYPGLPDLIDSLHKSGIKVLTFYTGCINSTAYLSKIQKCKTYDFVVANNFAVNHNKESKWFKGDAIHVDPTNAKAKEWWHTQVDVLHNLKLDGAKIDFGFAWFGDTIQTSIGPLSRREFGYQYYADAFDYNTSRNDEFVAMTYGWSGRGLMGFPSKCHVNWVGDFNGDWKGIKKQLINIYKSANYGFSGVGCEIGGYWNVPSNKDQFIRYAQLSSLCPIMINGGSLGAFAHHLPWYFDDETVAIYQKFVAMHTELSYYLFSASVDAHLNTSTIMKNCSMEQESHFLGDQLFVKVKTDSLPLTKIHLPASGKWIDFWNDHQVYKQGTILDRQYSLNMCPLFIRNGAIIPLCVSNDLLQHSKFNNSQKTTFLIYPDSVSNYVLHKPIGSGAKYRDISVTVNKLNGTINVVSQVADEFVFIVKWDSRPRLVKGADKWEYDTDKKTLYIDKKGKQFELSIKE
jgi:alpha-glucosidase (family GH31 glycosyl hydrolase)